MKKALWMFAIGLFFPALALAQFPKAGNTGFAFLKIGVGGRGPALANANFADASGATAAYWNPANLAGSRNEVFFSHAEWLQDINREFIAVKFSGLGAAWAFSLQLQDVGGIEQRTIASAEPIGEITARDVAFGLSYARKIGPALDFGVTLKYLGERILNYAANGIAVDLGGRYRFEQLAGLGVAVSLHNIGTAEKLLTEKITLPTSLRAGLVYEPLQNLQNNALKLFAGYEKIFQAESAIGAGIEFVASKSVALRAGYRFDDDSRGISGGIGLIRSGYQLDYAYTPFDFDLGDTHNISLAIGL